MSDPLPAPTHFQRYEDPATGAPMYLAEEVDERLTQVLTEASATRQRLEAEELVNARLRTSWHEDVGEARRERDEYKATVARLEAELKEQASARWAVERFRSEDAASHLDEQARLRATIARLEAENQQLRQESRSPDGDGHGGTLRPVNQGGASDNSVGVAGSEPADSHHLPAPPPREDQPT